MDNNKLSHEDLEVVTVVIDFMKTHFGDLTVTRGNTHMFLGMNTIVNKQKTIKIEMKDQLQEAMGAFTLYEGGEVNEEVMTPARPRLREVNRYFGQLAEEKNEACHSIVAKLLWIVERAYFDLEMVLDFFCSRVSMSDEDDWKKLRGVIAYIKGTINDVRIIGASDLMMNFTWIDAVNAVNSDMKSQTGGTTSLEMGALHTKSCKKS